MKAQIRRAPRYNQWAMLLELRIENLLVIERAELRFGDGLNAITGETGAGKTVLAHSLDLLMGGRARPQVVRPGAGEAWVEGVFELPDGLLDDPDLADLADRVPGDASEIVLGRRVGASGRTTAFVQGRAASAADLQLLGGRLLAFFGQHEHRKLTLGAAQAQVLDGFGGPEVIDLRNRYRAVHGEVVALTRELEELSERDGSRERDLDLLRFELDEIEAAAPDPDEDEALEDERERLRHAESLREAAGGALGALDGADGDGGARGILAAAQAGLDDAGGVDRRLDTLAGRVGALAVEVGDAASELRAYLEDVEADPARLAEVEERVEAIAGLKRKHGGSVESILAHADRCRAEVERLEGAGERTEELERRLAEAGGERERLAGELSERRRAAAAGLEERMKAELSLLAMEEASFEVAFEPHPAGFGALGSEVVEFRVAVNPGMPAGPLRDVASGGELSRLMLALSGLGSAAGAPTVVFDEIDAGIGGATARAVGERLRSLADGAGKQVVCITHLPQVAARAHTHFTVAKRVADGATVATVERVDGDELVGEICRMLGADGADEAASRHARELLAA